MRNNFQSNILRYLHIFIVKNSSLFDIFSEMLKFWRCLWVKGRFWYPEINFVKNLRFWVTGTINMSEKLSFRWYHINMDHWLRIDKNFRLKIIFLVKTCWICKLWTGFTQIVKMTKMQIQEKLDLSGFLSDRPVQYTKMTGNSNTAQ